MMLLFSLESYAPRLYCGFLHICNVKMSLYYNIRHFTTRFVCVDNITRIVYFVNTFCVFYFGGIYVQRSYF